jgi:hypothetical protein
MKIEDRKQEEGKRSEHKYSLLKQRMDELVKLMFEEPRPVIKTM